MRMVRQDHMTRAARRRVMGIAYAGPSARAVQVCLPDVRRHEPRGPGSRHGRHVRATDPDVRKIAGVLDYGVAVRLRLFLGRAMYTLAIVFN